ncbi:MAG TPA: radical SAM protein [Candidatus Acidoferrales bacterium]|jgi:MoaA/NifB/PqqE/SkfB family radical SAM enzyme|nr:radical SAM protein [Candidatus Acidoferrales bacterium]
MEKFLSIHVTDLCNSKCSFCVVASPFYLKNTVEYKDILRFLEGHAGQGWDAVNLHGGEATIHPKFIEILETIQRLGYPEVHLQTNAIKLADAAFAEKVANLGVKKFIISLHGDSPELQDSQTGSPGGFVRTIQGIRNVKGHGTHVRTNTVITRKNLPHLTGICRLACEIGVDHINLSNLHPVGSAIFSRSNAMPKFEEMRQQVYAAVDFVASCGRQMTLEGFPYCAVSDRLEYQLNNEHRIIRMLMRGSIIDDYDNFMSDSMRIYGEACSGCAVREKCGGVYPEYIQCYGWDEISTISSEGSVKPEQLQAQAC